MFLILCLFLLIREDSYAQIYKGQPVREPSRRTPTTKQLIVTFKDRPTAATLISLSRKSARAKLKYSIVNTKSLVYEAIDKDVVGVMRELQSSNDVETVVRDQKLDLLYLPNDLAIRATPVPGKPKLQWNMFNLNLAGTGQSAWDISKGSLQTVVAVLDSGIDSAHEDLVGKIASLVDCTVGVCRTVTSMTADPGNLDDSHGTHVAGIIGAATDNNLGIAATGFNTKLMILKIRDSRGDMLISYFTNALRYAADQGAKVINMSLGSLADNLDGPVIAQINDAVNYAWSRGSLLVAAAGNCGWDVSHHRAGGDPCDIYDTNGNFVRHAVNEKFYPATSPNVISVAALDVNNNLAPYSEHNDSGNAQIGNWVSVAAPGGQFSTNSDKEFGIASTWPLDSYYYLLGTSSAAPHVAGIAALIWAAKPSLSNQQIKTIIETTSNPNVVPGKTNFGMVNAFVALNNLNITITPGVPTPTNIIPSNIPTPTLLPTLTAFPTPTLFPSITSVFPSPTSIF
ncbi:hypothetical protein A2W14_02695, partial [Candidatus Gottesmanbacteria bacterium RBG_16_37_8]